MDAGIPIQRHVAGISVGLCTEYGEDGKISQYKLLTDIIGWEDAFCDMDCKIAGTERGISGFQIDLKLKGVPHKIIEEAIDKAKAARMQILEIMSGTIAAPRPEMSKYAPRYASFKINPEKIGLVIGPNGKNIKKITEETGCEISIEPDGTVDVFGINQAAIDAAREAVQTLIAEPEVGKIYKGKVVTITDFGAFVEFLPGQDGLVHVSELADRRVRKVEDVVKVGDEIYVKCVGVDEKNRVKLSRKAAMEAQKEELLRQHSSSAEIEEEEKNQSPQAIGEKEQEGEEIEAGGETNPEDIEQPQEGGNESEDIDLRQQEPRKSEPRPSSQRSEGRSYRPRQKGEQDDRQQKSQSGQRRGNERSLTGEEPEVGKNYRGRVTSIKEYGAFIEFMPGVEGLCHVSELANFRVKRTEDIVKIGDEITVKYLGRDDKGRIKLSRRAVISEREQADREGRD